MEIKGKAFNRIDRILLGLCVPFGLVLFGVLAPHLFRDPEIWALFLFSFPMSIFLLGMAFVGLMYQFSWVKITGDKATYKGLIQKYEYEWNQIDKTEFPVTAGGTTPFALLRLNNGKKKYLPCGDPEIRKLISTHVIEKMVKDKIAEQNGGEE